MIKSKHDKSDIIKITLKHAWNSFVEEGFLLGRWHDAGSYDAKTKTGGPNGSIRFMNELNHTANKGLKIAVDFCGKFFYLF